MVELIIDGKTVELQEKGNEIKYNMQIADVFDIASVSASYTNSFSIPKTPKNTGIFEQLGIIGDTSTVPYRRVTASLKNNGFDVISKGWLEVKETSDNYRVNIVDGMIDFFKEIENKTLGNDLDLSSFNHVKNLTTVVDSVINGANKPYRYLVGDFNGKNTGFGLSPNSTVIEGINIDYLVPSFSIEKLFDLIFSTYGFTYEVDQIEFIKDLYITYPLPPQDGAIYSLIARFLRPAFNSRGWIPKRGGRTVIESMLWTTIDITEGSVLNGYQYVIPENGGYSVKVSAEAYLKHVILNNTFAKVFLFVTKNDVVVWSGYVPEEEVLNIDQNFNAYAGDVIECFYWQVEGVQDTWELRNNFLSFEVYKSSLGEVSLTNAFKDFKIKDFFKEFIWRTGLTPVIDPLTSHMTFLTLKERLDFSEALDWSGKYVKRLSESYILEGYGQKNSFKLKHDDPLDNSGNGYLFVENENITDEVTLAESRIFMPELQKTIFVDSIGNGMFESFKFKIWNREPKEDSTTGSVSIDYKGLSNRFYLVRVQDSPVSDYNLVTEVFNEGLTLNSVSLPHVGIDNTLFESTIYENYFEFNYILTNFKVLNIELALSLNDVINIDLAKPYYLKPEGQYFMLNRLQWQDGKTCTGEFIRINKLN